MTNKPMLSVERELLERILDSIRFGEMEELRAILDIQVIESQYDGMTQDQAQAVSDGVDEILHGKPADKHNGEPVAWLIQCQHSGLVEQSEPNNKSNHPDDWSDAFPVFREQPAPVEVTITDEQILEAMRHSINSADGGYVVDTAPENVIAAGRALLESARLNGLKS